MIQKQHLLSRKKHLLSTDQDFQIKLNLETKDKLLKESEIIEVLNLETQFLEERQNSTTYRFYGKITLTTYDEQTKVTNINTFSPIDTVEIKKTFKTLSNKDIDILNKDNWSIQLLYPFSSDTISDVFDIVVFEDDFKFNKGWTFRVGLTLDSSTLQITNESLKHTGKSTMSPSISSIQNILDIGKQYEITYEVKTIQGNSADVRLYAGEASSPGILRNSVGKFTEILTSTGHRLIFKFSNGIGNNIEIDNIVIKIINQSKKKYKRLFKVLTNINDYDIFKSGFETNIFSDKTIQFIFNKDIDISNLTDHLNRPISEFYLGIVKKSGTTITDLKEGFNRTYPDSVIKFDKQINESYIGDEVVFDHVNLLQEVISTRFHKFRDAESGNFIFEDKFNLNFNKGWEFSQDGTIIDNVLRFSTKATPALIYTTSLILVPGKIYTLKYEIVRYASGSVIASVGGSNNNNVRNSIGAFTELFTAINILGIQFIGQGADLDIDNILLYEGDVVDYYYKPFYKINIKKFSNIILEGNTGTTLNIPSYAEIIDDGGNRKWKNLLDVGSTEDDEPGVNYPFVNSSHYLYDNYNFFIRRVDPLHNLPELQIKPIDKTIIEVVDKFGDEPGIPIDQNKKC